MLRNKFLIFIFFWLLIFSAAKSPANDNTGNFDRDEWKEITDGADYTEEKEPAEDKEIKSIDIPRDTTWFGGGGEVFQIILFAILAAIIIFILYKLIKSNIFVKNKKVSAKKVFTIEEIDEHIHETDLEGFLRESLVKKDYRQAVRIYYLMVIRGLSFKKLIDWQKDKTNFQYLMEVRKSDLYNGFSDLTLIYEQIWYGNAGLDEHLFGRLLPVFRDFITEIEKKRS